MKLLVCTDGSEHSQKAVKEAARIAANMKTVDICLINVYELVETSVFDYDRGVMQAEELKKNERAKQILQEAVKVFEKKNLHATTILKRGHPSLEIIKETAEGDFDLVILGSRRFSGLKKIFLGSVSNAVAQGVNANVLIVKHIE